jgi:hypothetical protein
MRFSIFICYIIALLLLADIANSATFTIIVKGNYTVIETVSQNRRSGECTYNPNVVCIDYRDYSGPNNDWIFMRNPTSQGTGDGFSSINLISIDEPQNEQEVGGAVFDLTAPSVPYSSYQSWLDDLPD